MKSSESTVIHFNATDASHELLDDPHERYGGIAIAIFWVLIILSGLSVLVAASHYMS